MVPPIGREAKLVQEVYSGIALVWIQGYWLNAGTAKGDVAELWGLREGLRIVKKMNFSPLVIESDSMTLVDAINKGVNLLHPCRLVLEDCKDLMFELGVREAYHVFREANRCAEKLAKLGLSLRRQGDNADT